jgi:hypothetical protein
MKAALALCALAPAGVLAHDGHGLAGSHWHATDVWGLLALAAVLAAAAWFQRRK